MRLQMESSSRALTTTHVEQGRSKQVSAHADRGCIALCHSLAAARLLLL